MARRARKSYPVQPTLGLKVGDRVTVDHAEMNKHLVLPEDKDFYGKNVGVIVGFLNSSTAPNNGAALVDIKQKYGMVIRAYMMSNKELVKVK